MPTIKTIISVIMACSSLPVEAGTIFTLGAGIDSKYISEGRDNLNGQALNTVHLLAENKLFVAGAWYGQSEDNIYRESNFFLGLSKPAYNKLVIDLHYTYLRFSEPDTDDHEISLAATAGDDSGLQGVFSSVYSQNARGYYHSLEALYKLELA